MNDLSLISYRLIRIIITIKFIHVHYSIFEECSNEKEELRNTKTSSNAVNFLPQTLLWIRSSVAPIQHGLPTLALEVKIHNLHGSCKLNCSLNFQISFSISLFSLTPFFILGYLWTACELIHPGSNFSMFLYIFNIASNRVLRAFQTSNKVQNL